MVGDTNTTVSQRNEASSGPVSAGSQTARPESGATIQANNRSYGATATGEPVVSNNSINAHNGPYASGPGSDAAMVGDSNLDIGQDARARGGSASSGSQDIGARNGAIAQVGNSCGDAVTETPCGIATAGGVIVSNTLGSEELPSGAGPIAISDGGTDVSASLIGDADAVFTQSAAATSGDATNGSQTTDVSRGTVQNDNFALNGEATSGPAAAINIGSANVGPSAASSTSASASQVGDASGTLDMSATASSGNAVTGSQTTGATGDSVGALTVQNRSASEDDTAVTGGSTAVNIVFAGSGPTALGGDAHAGMVGDSDFDIAVAADAASGDAKTGSQDTIATGSSVVQNDNDSIRNTAVSGDAQALNFEVGVAGPLSTGGTATLAGDATLLIDATATATSGDAVAGTQTADASDEAIVQDRNITADSYAESGPSAAGNMGVAVAGPVAESGDATQAGDAHVSLIQDADASSGTASVGHQDTTASDDSVVQNSNDTLGGTALSAAACASPLCGGTVTDVGDDPVDPADDTFAPVPGGNIAIIVAGPVSRGQGDASASIAGDTRADLTQVATATSGDATTGGQTTTATGGSTVQNENTSTNDWAGCFDAACEAVAGNAAVVVVGPYAEAAGGFSADATQEGDSDFDGLQTSEAVVGSSTAGSQYTDANDSIVQNRNTSEDALAEAGSATAWTGLGVDPFDVDAGPLVVGASAVAETADADAAQSGDSSLDVSLGAYATSGDAVAGSQLTVLDDGTSQSDNDSLGDTASSGPAEAWVVLVGVVGVDAVDGSVEQVGDNPATIDLVVVGSSGDAIAGSQVIDGSGVTTFTVGGPVLLSLPTGDGSVDSGSDNGLTWRKGTFSGAGIGA